MPGRHKNSRAFVGTGHRSLFHLRLIYLKLLAERHQVLLPSKRKHLSRRALAAVFEANDFPDKRLGDKNVLSLNFLSRHSIFFPIQEV